jgi:hypothetical protein
MTLFIRTALSLTAAVALVAGPALAQTAPAGQASTQPRPAAAPTGAAATLPNAFDAPATPARQGPARAPAPAPAVSSQVAEATLRSVIEQFAAGEINEALFTPDVARRLNANLGEYMRLIRGFGAVESIEAQTVNNGVGQFLVIFENAATQWQVGLDAGGLIAALRFREAPPESSEPITPGS